MHTNISHADIMEEVKLIGSFPSPFSYRVIWALKHKGIPYTYIEEDIYNKSALLLKYNPVHKKIPVLVHGDKAIAESAVILEYIEETWPDKPLLPKDPYDRAVARFWIKFAEEKSMSIGGFFATAGEQQQKAIKESLEVLKTIEEHSGLAEKKFFGGDEIGLTDLVFGVIAHWVGALEEVVGVKLFESHKFPHLHAWAQNFKNVPVIKENLPDYAVMAPFLTARRQVLLARGI